MLLDSSRVRQLRFFPEREDFVNTLFLRVSAFGILLYSLFSAISGSMHILTHFDEPHILVMVVNLLVPIEVSAWFHGGLQIMIAVMTRAVLSARCFVVAVLSLAVLSLAVLSHITKEKQLSHGLSKVEKLIPVFFMIKRSLAKKMVTLKRTKEIVAFAVLTRREFK